MCSHSYCPQSHYECVDGEYLVSCKSVYRRPTTSGKGTYEGDEGDPKFTDLLDNTLRCAISSRHDNPVVCPPNIEDTAQGLQHIVHKKRQLSRLNEITRNAGL